MSANRCNNENDLKRIIYKQIVNLICHCHFGHKELLLLHFANSQFVPNNFIVYTCYKILLNFKINN